MSQSDQVRAMADDLVLETLLLRRVAEGVVLVTLNRPEHGNGVVPAMIDDLLHSLSILEPDFSVRALVLTGAGRQFCAGADLHAMKTYLDEKLNSEQEPYNMRAILPVSQRLVACRIPIIAAINGGATAGGLDLAMACDIRIASRLAKLGETYVKVGLAPGNGGTYFLPKLVGSGMAAELAFTGDIIDADRALAIGLVNRVVDPEALIDEAVALAARIAERPRRAVEAAKQALRASWTSDLATAMAASYWSNAALQMSNDFREGVEAAIERRPARFNKIPAAP